MGRAAGGVARRGRSARGSGRSLAPAPSLRTRRPRWKRPREVDLRAGSAAARRGANRDRPGPPWTRREQRDGPRSGTSPPARRVAALRAGRRARGPRARRGPRTAVCLGGGSRGRDGGRALTRGGGGPRAGRPLRRGRARGDDRHSAKGRSCSWTEARGRCAASPRRPGRRRALRNPTRPPERITPRCTSREDDRAERFAAIRSRGAGARERLLQRARRRLGGRLDRHPGGARREARRGGPGSLASRRASPFRPRLRSGDDGHGGPPSRRRRGFVPPGAAPRPRAARSLGERGLPPRCDPPPRRSPNGRGGVGPRVPARDPHGRFLPKPRPRGPGGGAPPRRPSPRAGGQLSPAT